MISGFVDQPEHIDRIIRIAEEYYPKVINNMTVGGCQQVLLHVKIMEVSRDQAPPPGLRLRQRQRPQRRSRPSPIGPVGQRRQQHSRRAAEPSNPTALQAPSVVKGAGGTFAFGVANGSSAFFGVLDALREDGLAKILAEPTLMTDQRPSRLLQIGRIVLHRPARTGGMRPSRVNYGTQLDFVPIVLGNGQIHLDVRPNVSEIDPSLPSQGYRAGHQGSQSGNGRRTPGGPDAGDRRVGAERVEAENAGLPWISEVPYLGAAFRRVNEQVNEIELLIMVTPELVEGDGRLRSAAVRAGHANHQPQRLGTVHERTPGSAQVLPDRRSRPVPAKAATDAEGPPPPDGMILGPGEKFRPHAGGRRGPPERTAVTLPLTRTPRPPRRPRRTVLQVSSAPLAMMS